MNWSLVPPNESISSEVIYHVQYNYHPMRQHPHYDVQPSNSHHIGNGNERKIELALFLC